MPTVGKQRNMMIDTTLSAPSKEDTSKSNLTIQEDAIFQKPVKLEEKVAPEPEVNRLQPPEKKKMGRPKMTDERREEVRKERAARLVAGRAKSLENRRKKALEKKIVIGKEAELKINQKSQEPVPEPVPQPVPEPAPQPAPPISKLPDGFAGSAQPMKKLVEQQQFDYNKIIDGVWSKMSNYNQGIDDQALIQYQEKIRKEEQARAQLALKSEYEKINKAKARMNQMHNSVNLLQGRSNNNRSNHRVFGRKPRGQSQVQSQNPFDICFQ